jgi:hypothetical protein
VVQTYKYLGFPHNSRGVDTSKLLEEGIRKGKAALRTLQKFGQGYSEEVKLNLVKVKINPVLEYGAALMFTAKTDLKMAQELQDEAMKYIMPYAPHPKGVRALTGVPPIVDRFRYLAGRFGNFLDSMSPASAAHLHLQKLLKSPPWPEQILLPRIWSTRKDPSTLKKEALQAAQASLHSKFVKDFKPNGISRTLFIQTKEIRVAALTWRLGSAFVQRYCPNLTNFHFFRRPCLNNCGLGRFLPHTDLDELLNTGEYERFWSTFRILKTIIYTHRP